MNKQFYIDSINIHEYSKPDCLHRKRRQWRAKRSSVSCHVQISHKWFLSNQNRILIHTSIHWLAVRFRSLRHWQHCVPNCLRQCASAVRSWPSIHWSMYSIALNCLKVFVSRRSYSTAPPFNLFIFFPRSAAPIPNGAENGCTTKLFDLAKSIHWIVDDSSHSGEGGLKRRMLPGNDDSDEETNALPPPSHDIYRLRQQKRFNKS